MINIPETMSDGQAAGAGEEEACGVWLLVDNPSGFRGFGFNVRR